jgi:hypothetical protein
MAATWSASSDAGFSHVLGGAANNGLTSAAPRITRRHMCFVGFILIFFSLGGLYRFVPERMGLRASKDR